MLWRRSRREYLKYRETARAQVHARLNHFNTFYKFPLKKVFIKNHKSRWGSCSERGNLNFNYKVVFLPVEIVDYIIVHELCHLAEFNHSPAFWAQVARALPNHVALRKSLRRLERNR
ncbi:MAG: M48 family metallopeptidase [Candidatus Adlerbacteria bacterium]|nr:M48 family metallopeptidase [Candidatus Adlerbacteria bacterium]